MNTQASRYRPCASPVRFAGAADARGVALSLGMVLGGGVGDVLRNARRDVGISRSDDRPMWVSPAWFRRQTQKTPTGLDAVGVQLGVRGGT